MGPMIRNRLIPAFLLLAIALLIQPAFSQQQQPQPAREFGPSWGIAYATNGREVQVVNLDGGGLFYPGPTEATVTEVDGGFVVELHTAFRYVSTKVYLPQVVR